ncbi:Neuropeptide-Like Protein [Caenorhabditis elegans]|uniref:Neuropeptide-Like Protein n=1 Tax=Caenorhabditis elegans TaxID=6239 RepID=Q8MNU5_CAEEL|nr:Neuropeptide-Like Protein [Caenorhabditis elegans]CCD67402.1 Neuropeptide-Like Protein [Caenorhabditis elegans]|eukprot:NP_741126.1 Neuropeptide-Like Protein [Caenorhabditis elegans]
MSLAQSTFYLLFVAFLAVVIAVTADKQQSAYDLETPISAYKRFYSWEDAKRAASSEEGMRNKRKQFYAWAGKRSSAPVHYFEDSIAQEAGPSMEKRKQFYAWAGK